MKEADEQQGAEVQQLDEAIHLELPKVQETARTRTAKAESDLEDAKRKKVTCTMADRFPRKLGIMLPFKCKLHY